MDKNFELCLFCVDPLYIQKAVNAGIDTIIVDWEFSKEKKDRQRGYSTQINSHAIETLALVRAAIPQNKIICRINGVGTHTQYEVQKAKELGADEILIPMVRSCEEVQYVLDLAEKKIKVGILIETNAAIFLCSKFSQMDLSRIYVGLNDLAIENQQPNIFLPLADGRVEKIRKQTVHRFGFGGLTLPHKGFPIPCHLLMGELIRLKAHFSFLRRSFLAHVPEDRLAKAVAEIREAIAVAKNYSSLEMEKNHQKLVEKIEELLLYGTALI